MADNDIQEKARELARSQHNPTEGVGIPIFSEEELAQKYPDESPSWAEQRGGEVPANHGFSNDPFTQLEAHLDYFDEIEAQEKEKWDKVGVDPEDKDEEDESAPHVITEQAMEGNMSMTLDELMSPLSSAQIMEQRKKPKARAKKQPKYTMEVRVFVMGGQDRTSRGVDGEMEPSYDDTKDKEDYQALVTEVLNSDGKAIFGVKQVESIQNTSKFKILLEVLRLVE